MNLQIIENRCRICATELTDLTCLIPIFPNDASNFFLLSKIHKYLYINVSIVIAKTFYYFKQSKDKQTNIRFYGFNQFT